MEALLTLNHPDYKLMVYCPSYDKIFKKAQTCMRVKQNDETLYSIYTWDKNAFTQINGEQLIEGKGTLLSFLKIQIINSGSILKE